jgi:hypothetical protein
MQDALKTPRGHLRIFCIIFTLLSTPGQPVGLIRLYLVFRTFFLTYLLPLRLSLVYSLCTMGCALFALF